MTILLAGSAPEDFGLDAQLATSDGADSDYTSRCILMSGGPSEFALSVESDATDVWVHFRRRPRGNIPNAAAENWGVVALDSNNSEVAGLQTPAASTGRAVVVGADGQVSGDSFTDIFGSGGPVANFDVHFWRESGALSVDVFVNGMLRSSASALGAAVVNRIDVRPIRETRPGVAYDCTLSEIVVTEGVPTVGFRLLQRPPVAPGYYDAFRGAWSNLVDPLAPGSVATNSGQRLSWKPSPAIFSAHPAMVRAVVSVTTISRLSGEPTQIAPSIRAAGQNFDAPAYFSSQLRQITNVWWANPASDDWWETPDAVAAEIGVLALD